MTIPATPSNAQLWFNCAGSLTLLEAQTNKRKANLGTVTHSLAEVCYKEGTDPFKLAEYAKFYVDYMRTTFKDCDVRLEQEFDVSDWMLSPDKTHMARPDAVVFGKEDGWIYVTDLKTGHEAVYATNNPQLRLSALGVWASVYRDEETFGKIKGFVLQIIQPPHKAVDEERLTVGELLGWGQLAKERYKLIPTEQFSPGYYCSRCYAANRCPNKRVEEALF